MIDWIPTEADDMALTGIEAEAEQAGFSTRLWSGPFGEPVYAVVFRDEVIAEYDRSEEVWFHVLRALLAAGKIKLNVPESHPESGENRIGNILPEWKGRKFR